MVLGVVVQVWQVGAHFEALVKLESMAPLLLPCIFFTYQTSPPAHCGGFPFWQNRADQEGSKNNKVAGQFFQKDMTKLGVAKEDRAK